MNKDILRERWGSFCNTDKLVDDTMELLTKYRHRNTEYGVCTMLDEYFRNKAPLIELLQKSDNYIGEMRIALDIELERENNAYDISKFCRDFGGSVGAKTKIIKYVDENGKKIDDYLRTGVKCLNIEDLDNEEIMSKLKKSKEGLGKFNSCGETKESSEQYQNFLSDICDGGTRYIYHSTLSEDDVANLHHKVNYKLAPGMKTSRAFNRICTYYKINECANYNKLFAQYADMVSGLKRKLKFFISVNPLDYLTMSFGKSWASCHTIDKTNVRHMPNSYSGMYCGGTLSYMLDSSSIITYVHTGIPESVEEGKLYRNMFHYKDYLLLQSRVYPQGNDGNTDLYKVFRGFVQQELASILGLERNMWTKKSGRIGGYIASTGSHYRDYTAFGDSNITYPSEFRDNVGTGIPIGHVGVCPYCGESINNCDRISHIDCNI